MICNAYFVIQLYNVYNLMFYIYWKYPLPIYFLSFNFAYEFLLGHMQALSFRYLSN
jgi:hypothetical protein